MADIGVIILSHNSVDNVLTYDMLSRTSCELPIHILVDNEDKMLSEYKARFRDELLVYDKPYVASKCDTFIGGDRNLPCAMVARNAALDKAKELGYNYLVLLDDDIKRMQYVYDNDGHLGRSEIKSFGSVIKAVVEFMSKGKVLATSFSFRASYFGGVNGQFFNKRLIQNGLAQVWIIDVNRSQMFRGKILEDGVYCYDTAKDGNVAFRITDLCFDALPMGDRPNKKEGLGETYNKYSELAFNFLLLPHPSILRVKHNENAVPTYGHNMPYVNMNYACPKIISGRYKK